ncbi:MAG: FtsX-like permease family protein, partial [Candidatus Bathyarchaeota archaeon]
MKYFKDRKEKIEFPFVQALWLSVEQIKKRTKRSVIVIVSIALGIALLTHLEMTNIIFLSYMKSTGIMIEAYQFWLIIVSLFVCGVGLINSNLITTYERYREIGIMKCLGALDQHVIKLFLLEAIIFGLVGGVFGFSVGSLTAILTSCIQLGVNILWQIPLGVVLQYLGLTTSLSIVLCIISTIFPALKAARYNPV